MLKHLKQLKPLTQLKSKNIIAVIISGALTACVAQPDAGSSTSSTQPTPPPSSASQSSSSQNITPQSSSMPVSSASISSAPPASSEASSVSSPVAVDFTEGQSLLTSTGTFNPDQEDFSASVKGEDNSVNWDRKATFTINSAQQNPWDIQLRHDLSVGAGYRVTVCFRASANSERTVKVNIDTDGPLYESLAYGGEEVVLTNQMQSYVQRFDISNTDASARVTFNLGPNTGTVIFDDIGVFTGDECITQAASSSNASSSTPAPASPPKPSYASGGTGGKIGSDTNFPCPGCLIGTPTGYSHSEATPLLITLHGDEGKADFIHRRYYSREGVAKKAGFIVASLKCPDSLKCDDTDKTSELKSFKATNSWWLWERFENAYDPEWINRQVDEIEKRYNIDRRKIYFAGFSGGSVLLSTWGFENSDRYAGMILSGGGAVAKTYRRCVTECPIPVYISIGQDDNLFRSATLTRDQASACGHEVEFSDHKNTGHVYVMSDLNKVMQWFKDRPHQCIK